MSTTKNNTVVLIEPQNATMLIEDIDWEESWRNYKPETPAITEAEMMPRPDTNVRSLDEYSSSELMSLNLGVSLAYIRTMNPDLAVWGERISNAYREAVIRENSLPF